MKRLLCIGFLLLFPVSVFAWEDHWGDNQDNFREERDNPQTVIGQPDGAVDPRTGTFYRDTGDGIYNSKGEYYPEVGPDQYYNPRTGRFIQRR